METKRSATFILLALFAVHSRGATLYVNVGNVSPAAPYSSWNHAAQRIQDAVDASTNGDLVLVTNGVYQTGSQVMLGTNRVVISKPITVASVNGPDATTISGNGTMRCVYLGGGASLSGFTLANGTPTYGGGGGIMCDTPFGGSIISNCALSGNVANSGGGADGGAFYQCKFVGNQGTANAGAAVEAYLFHCLIANNSAGQGGGTHSCLVDSCVVIGNSAGDGGGSYNGRSQNSLIVSNAASGTFGGGAARGTTLINCTVAWNQYNGFNGKYGGVYLCTCYNCIVYNNSSWTTTLPRNFSSTTLYNCCTTPLPTTGGANFTSAPLFSYETAGDFHLQTNSPCINSGNRGYNDGYGANVNDLDGVPRIVRGAVDLGAYESQSASSMLAYYWAQQYGIATDGTGDLADPDGDGMNNYQEWIAGTDPLSAASVLKLLPVSRTNAASGINLKWVSVSGKTYYVQRSTDLRASVLFLTIQSNIAGQPGLTTFTDVEATNSGPYFYRIGVQ